MRCGNTIGKVSIFWCTTALVFLGVVSPDRAIAVDDEGLIEIRDGDIVDGTDPGCTKSGVPQPPATGVGGVPDWASLFTTTGGPNGTVTGTVDPLPAGGVIATFTRDDLSQSSAIDCTTFGPGSNKNGDPIDTWEFQPGNVPAKDDLAKLEGTVTAARGGGTYIITLENGVTLSAKLSGNMKRFKIRVIVGDKVTVGVSPYDPTHGLIIHRQKV